MEVKCRPYSFAKALLTFPPPAALCRAEGLIELVAQVAAQPIQQARAPAGTGWVQGLGVLIGPQCRWFCEGEMGRPIKAELAPSAPV